MTAHSRTSAFWVFLAALAGATLLLAPVHAHALRYATPSERRALIEAAIAGYPSDSGYDYACDGRGFITKISTVDARYGRVSFNNTLRFRLGCGVGDGFGVFHRGPRGRWREMGSYAWDFAPCRTFGVRLALDLTRDARLRCG